MVRPRPWGREFPAAARCPTTTYTPTTTIPTTTTTTTSTICFHACTSHHGGPAGVPPSPVAHVASVACPAVRTHGLAGPGMAPAPPSTRSRTAPAPGLVAWCDGHAGGACGVGSIDVGGPGGDLICCLIVPALCCLCAIVSFSSFCISEDFLLSLS